MLASPLVTGADTSHQPAPSMNDPNRGDDSDSDPPLLQLAIGSSQYRRVAGDTIATLWRRGGEENTWPTDLPNPSPSRACGRCAGWTSPRARRVNGPSSLPRWSATAASGS